MLIFGGTLGFLPGVCKQKVQPRRPVAHAPARSQDMEDRRQRRSSERNHLNWLFFRSFVDAASCTAALQSTRIGMDEREKLPIGAFGPSRSFRLADNGKWHSTDVTEDHLFREDLRGDIFPVQLWCRHLSSCNGITSKNDEI